MLALERMMNMRHVIDNLKNHKNDSWSKKKQQKKKKKNKKIYAHKKNQKSKDPRLWASMVMSAKNQSKKLKWVAIPN